MGKEFNPEPAWVAGGAPSARLLLWPAWALFEDWWQQAMGNPVPEAHEVEDQPGILRYFGTSYDHKVIGIQYGFISMALLALGGTFALIFRLSWFSPGCNSSVTSIQHPDRHARHGADHLDLVGHLGARQLPGPLLIGAKDMAFPRLNAFGFWLAVPASVILVLSMPGGFDTGWTGYPPLSVRGPIGMQMFFVGVFFAGWSSILGALNLIVTILRLRAKGMNLFRMPIFVWAVLATSLIALTATQLIGIVPDGLFERLFGMGFFDPAKGGNPLLFQHLFWFYSHPAVYIFILPGLGIISELLPVFVRKPLFGYKWVAMSSMGIALVGFLVWAHHMFASGMEEYLRVPFMYSTLLVAVPTGVKFFSWMATIWQGSCFPTPMLFRARRHYGVSAGRVDRAPVGTVATDLHLHDTYFVVGHFHDTMFGGYIFPCLRPSTSGSQDHRAQDE